MNITRIIIVANGTLNPSFLSELHSDDFVIGVDRAAYWLIQKGIVPDIAIGDFDSTSKNELLRITNAVKEVIMLPPHPKDHTDTELAVQKALAFSPKDITLYGAVGSRIDHTLGNIAFLEQCLKEGVRATIRDDHNVIQLLGRGRTIIKRRGDMRYFSVLAYTPSMTISLHHVKYEVTKKSITQSMSLGISNEFVCSQGTVTVHKGLALVIQSRD